MLDKEKLLKLEPLTKHEKFGRLLTEAIRGWEINDPVQCSYGIRSNNKKFFSYEESCCCLISAALIDKKDAGYIDEDLDIFSNVHQSAMLEFHLTKNEIYDLMSGFDGDSLGKGSEAYNFAREIATILFD
jgi:hypothetical protein